MQPNHRRPRFLVEGLQMNQFLAILRSRRGRIVSAVIASGQSDPGLIEAFRQRFLRPRRQEAYQTLRRGIQRGELPRNLDLDLILDILYGAIYMRFLIRHDQLSERYIAEVCRLVLNGATKNGHLLQRSEELAEAMQDEPSAMLSRKSGAQPGEFVIDRGEARGVCGSRDILCGGYVFLVFRPTAAFVFSRVNLWCEPNAALIACIFSVSLRTLAAYATGSIFFFFMPHSMTQI